MDENAEATDNSAEDLPDGPNDEDSSDGSSPDTPIDSTNNEPQYKDLNDYMNQNNYGKDDFDTYSKDPEWQRLHNQEFPGWYDQHKANNGDNSASADVPNGGYDLPDGTKPIEDADNPSEENAEVPDDSANDLPNEKQPQDAADPIGDNPDDAYQKLNQYMNDHNYGMDDYDTYSQDPEWQELNKNAFPDHYDNNVDTGLSEKDLPPDNGSLEDRGAANLPNRVDKDDMGVEYGDAGKPTDFSSDDYERQSVNDAKDLDYDQRRALEGYSNDDYKKMNAELRGKDVDYATPEQKARLDDQAKTISDTLDNKNLPEDMTLYRGTNDPEHIFGKGYQDKSLEQLRQENIGTVFCDDGFCSTSIDRGTAEDFARSWIGTVMEVSAPEGANGMCMHDVSGHAGENEVLLQKGSCFRIDDINYDRSSGYTVKTTLIGRRK